VSPEVGPIRPPSEAGSLLVRVSRNCPWNRCAFCPVFKEKTFSRRSVREVLCDLDDWRERYGDGITTVFLQDANPLLTRADDLVTILEAIRERFPRVHRITAYARSNTLAKRSLEDLARIRRAGLDRLHVGLESGCDAVLETVSKGTTRAEQIEAGRKAKETGFELSEYVMPGLGGRRLTDAHARDTASAVRAIGPDFVRIRTTAVVPGTGLAELAESGAFDPLSEVESVEEIRRFLTALDGCRTRIESDHDMNLLLELRGRLPEDLEALIALIDRFLNLDEAEQDAFVFGRRTGLLTHLDRMKGETVSRRIRESMADLRARGVDPLAAAAILRMQRL